MYELEAYAIRRDGVALVKITGMLADTCHHAAFADKYPGGNLVYVRDPEEAQVFIEETVRPDSGFCVFKLVPWSIEVRIPDDYHELLGVYVNGERALRVPIHAEPDTFQVIALVGQPRPTGCSVIPADAFFPMIYYRAFGPGSKEECDKWVVEHCAGMPAFA
jgi:hypothetical protein